MQAYPHHYRVQAFLDVDNDVTIDSENLPRLESAPPEQFGGPGDRWSPETLLVAAVADCFLLTFKAIARASGFSWSSLYCDVEGILDRTDTVSQFTEFTLSVFLVISSEPGQQEVKLKNKAERLLKKSEESCLITNSLKASTHLNIKLEFSSP